MSKGVYFDIRKVVSYNKLFNFVVSKRGAGKSYSTLAYFCLKFIKKGEQFVYIRRLEQELDATKAGIFDDINNSGMYSGFFYSIGDTIYYRHSREPDDKTAVKCGLFIPLSCVSRYKSRPFPQVKRILFEEFIDEKGAYLKKEVDLFLSIYSTISRTRDIPVYFLANTISLFNPYYVFFGLKGTKTIEVKDDIILYEYKNKNFDQFNNSTRFAKIIKDSQYGKFMLENKAILDDYSYIEEYKGKKEYQCSFEHENNYYGLFATKKGYYCSTLRDKGNRHFTIDNIIKSATRIEKGRQGVVIRLIRRAIKQNCLYFENLECKKICESLFVVKL